MKKQQQVHNRSSDVEVQEVGDNCDPDQVGQVVAAAQDGESSTIHDDYASCNAYNGMEYNIC